jgi:hypothetical protein
MQNTESINRACWQRVCELQATVTVSAKSAS